MTTKEQQLAADIDTADLANYLRGCALHVAFDLPELENKDTFDWMAETVVAYLRMKELGREKMQ